MIVSGETFRECRSIKACYGIIRVKQFCVSLHHVFVMKGEFCPLLLLFVSFLRIVARVKWSARQSCSSTLLATLSQLSAECKSQSHEISASNTALRLRRLFSVIFRSVISRPSVTKLWRLPSTLKSGTLMTSSIFSPPSGKRMISSLLIDFPAFQACSSVVLEWRSASLKIGST